MHGLTGKSRDMQLNRHIVRTRGLRRVVIATLLTIVAINAGIGFAVVSPPYPDSSIPVDIQSNALDLMLPSEESAYSADTTLSELGPFGWVQIRSEIAPSLAPRPTVPFGPAVTDVDELNDVDTKYEEPAEVEVEIIPESSDEANDSTSVPTPEGTPPDTRVANATAAGSGLVVVGDGLSDPEAWPSDSTGAVGPRHYVEIINNKVGVFNKSDFARVDVARLGSFVRAKRRVSVFDPQIVYDPVGRRWFFAAVYRRQTARGALREGFLTVAYSKSSNPSNLKNGWCHFRIPSASPTGPYVFDDYPKLGQSSNHLLIGSNMFDPSGVTPENPTGARGSSIVAIAKPVPASRRCVKPTASRFGMPEEPLALANGHLVRTPVPANIVVPSDTGYVMNSDYALLPSGQYGSENVNIFRINGPGEAPSITSEALVATPQQSWPSPAPQPGGRPQLDTLRDGRLTQVVAAPLPNAPDPSILAVWTQHTVGNDATGLSQVEWMQFGVAPAGETLIQSNLIARPDAAVFNAAISPTIDGLRTAIHYNISSDSIKPSIRARTRFASMPLGEFSGEFRIRNGPTGYRCSPVSDAQPYCRWGDYAGASPDPSSNKHVWGSSQLPPSRADWLGTDHIATANFRIRVCGLASSGEQRPPSNTELPQMGPSDFRSSTPTGEVAVVSIGSLGAWNPYGSDPLTYSAVYESCTTWDATDCTPVEPYEGPECSWLGLTVPGRSNVALTDPLPTGTALVNSTASCVRHSSTRFVIRAKVTAANPYGTSVPAYSNLVTVAAPS